MRVRPAEIPVFAERPGFTSRLDRAGELDIAVETLAGGQDATEAFRSLPDGRCQFPHWGYMIKGRMRIKYADREEVISAGDVWYMPPGHIPVVEEDTENVVISLAGEYEKVMTALARARGGGEPHRG